MIHLKRIGLVPLILNKNKDVDYSKMKVVLDKNSDLDGLILFSPCMEGNTFSVSEKKDIYLKLKKLCNTKLIYEVSSSLLDEEINILKEIKPDAIMLTLLKEKKVKDIGHELYVINKMKRLNIPFFVHHERDMNGSFLTYKNIVKIKRILPTFLGIFEENPDYNLLRKVSNINNFDVYTTIINDLSRPKDYKIEGIISDLYLSFKNEIDEYYLELENHFVNPILKEYLEFVESIIDEYPRAMAIKYILARGSNIKMYSRLPYYSLNEQEQEKLNYLF